MTIGKRKGAAAQGAGGTGGNKFGGSLSKNDHWYIQQAFGLVENPGSGWSATGGNSTVESGGNKYHVFTTPGTFAITGSIPSVDIVVVGGGGGGYPGNPAGGGGGGGGVYIRTLSDQAVDLIATIGEGGNPNPNTAGEASILATPTSPEAYKALGGSIGGSDNNGGNSYPPGEQSAGPYLYQHGSGGASNGDSGGGGGGSGEAANGEAGPSSPGCSATGADGGTGMGSGGKFAGPVFSPIMPTDFVSALGPAGRFGGGGAGAIRCAPGGANTPGSGGEGGGGRGGAEPNHPGGGDPGRNGGGGVANTGGGGGGAHSYGGVGGAGGDGVVIIRYAT